MIKETEQHAGKTRRGNKNAYRKAPAHIVQERVEMVADMLAHGANQREIRFFLEKKQNLNWRMVPEYIGRAREWILKEASGITKTQALAEAIQFYQRTIANKKFHIRDKLEARKRLDLIFGLEAPRRLAIRDEMPPIPADNAARLLDSGMLAALETVYGADARKAVIEIESARVLPAADTKKRTLRIA